MSNPSEKGLVSKIYKELIRVNIIKKKNSSKSRQKTGIDIFPKKI